MNNVVQKLRRKVSIFLARLVNRGRFERDIQSCVPHELRSATRFAYGERPTSAEKAIAQRIERMRSRIPEIAADSEVYSFGSPRSSSFVMEQNGHAQPGPRHHCHIKQHMKTGIDKRNGILLRRIVEGTRAARILELGTNTGLSAAYMLSVPSVEEVVTVEGSPELCQMAECNMRDVASCFRLLNVLFDEAIDLLSSEGAIFDLVFVDGQHEREATLHYTRRVLPLLADGATLVYDDIYWSEGMADAWDTLRRLPEICHTVDLGVKGIAIVGNRETAQHFDIGQYVGRPAIYRIGW